jgi:hypothetical protein
LKAATPAAAGMARRGMERTHSPIIATHAVGAGFDADGASVFHCLLTLRRHTPSMPPGAGPEEAELLSNLLPEKSFGP